MFYIASIDADDYIKPGITTDYIGRATGYYNQRGSKVSHREGNLPYDGNYWCSDLYPRPWIWVAEQIVLASSKAYRPKTIPSHLAGCAGLSELRTPDLSWECLRDLFLEVINAIEEEFGDYELIYKTYMRKINDSTRQTVLAASCCKG